MSENIDRNTLRRISCGMYIVSSEKNGKYNGQIADTVFQVTNDPPRIAAAISKANLTHEYIAESGRFCVSILHQETPMTFIGTFGFRSGRVIDKFDNTEYKIGENGCPIVTQNVVGYIEASVEQEVDSGTHTVFIGKVTAAGILKEDIPLTYKYYREEIKGKTPVDSPTYIPDE